MATKKMYGVQDAMQFIKGLRIEAEDNSRNYKTLGLCIIVLTGLLAIGDFVFHKMPLVVVIIGVLTIILGTMQTFLTFFGYHKKYKNCMNAKQSVEKLLVEFCYGHGDFKDVSKKEADGVFAAKFLAIKTSYEQGVSETMDDINQLINK